MIYCHSGRGLPLGKQFNFFLSSDLVRSGLYVTLCRPSIYFVVYFDHQIN